MKPLALSRILGMVAAVAALSTVVGCGQSHSAGTPTDGGSSADGGRDAAPADADLDSGAACGALTCGAGEQCCCPGVCASAEMCALIDCAPMECDAQDALGLGFCDLFLGYRYNGVSCEGLSGCDCVGDDCDALFMDQSACEAAHSECTPRPSCGGLVGATCGAGSFCEYGAGQCQGLDASGVCQPRPTGCSRELQPVCGCDGEDYGNPCEARRAGTDILHGGNC